jgi:hypothetical protein
MIHTHAVSGTFRRPLTPPQSMKDRLHRKIERDIDKYLKAGGQITKVSYGVTHSPYLGDNDDDLDFELTTVQVIDI